MEGLTAAQRKVLEFIEAQDVPPSLREITEKFGWSGPAACQCHLKALRAKGFVTWVDFKARTLQSTRRGLPLLTLEDLSKGAKR